MHLTGGFFSFSVFTVPFPAFTLTGVGEIISEIIVFSPEIILQSSQSQLPTNLYRNAFPRLVSVFCAFSVAFTIIYFHCQMVWLIKNKIAVAKWEKYD